MSSESFQEVLASRKSLIQIESSHRAGGALADAPFVDSNNDCRAMEPVDQPGSRTSHHSDVPSAGGQDQRRGNLFFVGGGDGLRHHIRIDVLPFAIEFLKPFGQSLGLRR